MYMKLLHFILEIAVVFAINRALVEDKDCKECRLYTVPQPLFGDGVIAFVFLWFALLLRLLRVPNVARREDSPNKSVRDNSINCQKVFCIMTVTLP
jgi:hypothetical protein